MTEAVFRPGPAPRTVLSSDGELVKVPADWVLLPPGDAALTRRVKAAGDHWLVQEKKGRKVFSHGVWTSAVTIEQVRVQLEQERSTEQFARRKQADAARREQVQTDYVQDFRNAILDYLRFHAEYQAIANRLAKAVTEHATPVGSGTVARTKRIPIERRAEAAVIAWMRHQTTAYDSMKIPRERGLRREVRRMLAQRSKELLQNYRTGESIETRCPLRIGLSRWEHAKILAASDSGSFSTANNE